MRAEALMSGYLRQSGLRAGDEVPWTLQADLITYVERELAGSLGPASARILVDSYIQQREPELGKIIDAFGEVSLSLEQSRENLGRRVRELSILHEASTRLTSSLALPEIVHAVADLLTEEFSLDGVEVLMADADGRLEALHDPARAPSGAGRVDSAVLARSQAAEQAFRERRLFSSQEPSGGAAVPKPIRSYLAAPISSGETTLGVLFAYSAQSLVYFSPELRQLVQVVANQLGSALKNAQLYEELRLLSLDLDRKVQERTGELEGANERLREVDRLKSEFLSVVAHEFRTPLTSICSFSEILLGYRELDAVQMRGFVKIINDEGERLTRLITQLLDISRIEPGRLELALGAHGVQEVLEAAFRIADPVADRRGVRLELAVPPDLPTVRVDRDRMLQVVTNLLSNAVRVSPVGGVVRVSATRADGMVRISVADQGPGVAPADRETIFEKFARVGAERGPAAEGTGLGLFVARQIVEHHGGRLWVQEGPGTGADFRFTVPADSVGAREPTRPGSQAGTGG
jgi:phosphoserine phosphatase RsbU/P